MSSKAAFQKHRRDCFSFALSVWGKDFIDMFLNACLPSILSTNNIPKASRDFDIEFVIATRRQDVQHFVEHPLMTALKGYVQVNYNFSFEDSLRKDTDHFHPWRIIREAAKVSNRHFVSILPDVIYADGAIDELCEATRRYDFVFSVMPQVCKEFVLAAISNELRHGKPTSFSRHRLSELACRYMHPKHAAMIQPAQRHVSHQEYCVFPSRGSIGLLEIAGQPFGVSATAKHVTSGFDTFSEDFTFTKIPLMGVSLEDTLKYGEWFHFWRRAKGDGLAAFSRASWARIFYGPLNRAQSWLEQRVPTPSAFKRAAFDFETSVFPTTRKRYSHYCACVDLARLQLAVREGIAGSVDDAAAILCALPTISVRLRKLLLKRGEVTIFFPKKGSFSQLSLPEMESVAAQHIVRGSVVLAPGTNFTLTPESRANCGLVTSECQAAEHAAGGLIGRIVSAPLSMGRGLKVYVYEPVAEAPALGPAVVSVEPVPATREDADAERGAYVHLPSPAYPALRNFAAASHCAARKAYLNIRRGAAVTRGVAYWIALLRPALGAARSALRQGRARPPPPQASTEQRVPGPRAGLEAPVEFVPGTTRPATSEPAATKLEPVAAEEDWSEAALVLHELLLVREARSALELFSARAGLESEPAAVLCRGVQF